uniref:Uncharacterized protein n=1 Tax=Rhizophora mucronata TaxID=61149 RepID=A0A2P2J166_RHIMU
MSEFWLPFQHMISFLLNDGPLFKRTILQNLPNLW